MSLMGLVTTPKLKFFDRLAGYAHVEFVTHHKTLTEYESPFVFTAHCCHPVVGYTDNSLGLFGKLLVIENYPFVGQSDKSGTLPFQVKNCVDKLIRQANTFNLLQLVFFVRHHIRCVLCHISLLFRSVNILVEGIKAVNPVYIDKQAIIKLNNPMESRKLSRFIIIVAIISLAASALLYLLHYYIFQDSHHIFIYMLGDLAFIPLEVFLVVVVIERILTSREKHAISQKMNMVVGSFYSELGNALLGKILGSFDDPEQIDSHMGVNKNWSSPEFKQALVYSSHFNHTPNPGKLDLQHLKNLLAAKRSFMLTLLENPNLLEKDDFTDLLWASFHLGEELDARPSLENLPETDKAHLANDVKRMYALLLNQWIKYLIHLKSQYPHLYSLVLRTHPFQANPNAIIKE